MVRGAQGRKLAPAAVMVDSRTVQASPERGPRAGDEGAKRKRGSQGPRAVDTWGHLLALGVTAADEQDRAQGEVRAEQVPAVTGDKGEMAFVEQAYSGEQTAQAAEQ